MFSAASSSRSNLAEDESRFTKIESDLAILKWMIAGLYALGAPSLWLLLRVASKVGGLG